MDRLMPHNSYLALNRGRFRSEKIKLPEAGGFIHLTSRFEKGFSDLPHYHENSHLCFILSGGVLDRRKGFNEPRGAGELMLFEEGEPHQTIHQSFHVKNISIEFESSFFNANGMRAGGLKAALQNQALVKFSVLKIYREIIEGDAFSIPSMELLALGLLNNNRAGGPLPNWLLYIEEILNDRWNDELPLSELALASGVHPKTISKYFPKYFGCTLGEYRRRVKVERALALIRNSGLSLTEIAHQCNFFDQSHFTRIFKQNTGFLPKDFQKL